MGCDIHAYIDYDDFIGRDGEYWVSSFSDRINFGRNYTLFALMAGVRYDARLDRDYRPLFEPRGLPERVSWAVNGDYYIYVVEDDKELSDYENGVHRSQAEKWVERGFSVWKNDDKKAVSNPDWHSVSWLTIKELKQVKEAYEKIGFPDQSWFQFKPPSEQSVPEGARVEAMTPRFPSITGPVEWYVEVGERKTYPVPATFNAIVAAMEALEEAGHKTRLVFWFDN